MPATITNGHNWEETAKKQETTPSQTPKKLILCFDGTGNTFTGSNSDTNVVKLLSKLDRNAPDQYHYYQTGIGTYDIHDEQVNKSFVGNMKSNITQGIDQGFGTSFDSHVMAGYRFLMRYYDSGDKIYMFGFSRGAFTAKFLARMINTVGLLCKGNEEMVPFAYRLYQRYLAGEVEEFIEAHPKKSKKEKKNKNKNKRAKQHDTPPPTPPPVDGDRQPLLSGQATGQRENPEPRHDHNFEVARDELAAFSDTFCRKEDNGHCGESNIKVHFLGIWDCVNSVAVLERTAPVPVPVVGTAQHVRHAVAVDERRVKFKAALLAQDIREADDHYHDEDLKEVWFPGCHGDIGGGWPASDDNALDNSEINMTFWQRIKNFFTTRRDKEPSKALGCGRLQLSDISLDWMIREVQLVDEKQVHEAVTANENPAPPALQWRTERLKQFQDSFKDEKKKKQAMKGTIHDSLAFGCGTSFYKVLLWKLMEWIPFITRWELENDGWVDVRFPLNKGGTRDIPRDAILHESVLWRLKNDKKYCPKNNHGGTGSPCLKHTRSKILAECQCTHCKYCTHIEPHVHDPGCGHDTFRITRAAPKDNNQRRWV